MSDVNTATVGGQDTGADVTVNANREGQQDAKTYTQEDVEKMIQSETDKKVTKALETAKAKWEAEYAAKIEKEKDEAAKLAKMSADERIEAERKKEREAFEADRQAHIKEKLEFGTVKELATRKLPVSFAAFLCGQDADTTKSNIEEFEKAYGESIEEAVRERLKGNPPKAGEDKNQSSDPFLKGFESAKY